jgi:hypothetical protein
MANESLTSKDGASWERAAIEKLLLANLRERRVMGRWRIIRGLLWLVLAATVVWLAYADEFHSNKSSGPHTAIGCDGQVDVGDWVLQTARVGSGPAFGQITLFDSDGDVIATLSPGFGG